jgi:MFS family permease
MSLLQKSTWKNCIYRDPLLGNGSYRILLLTGLFWGTASSQLTLLAVVFRQHGFSDALIGWTFTAQLAGLVASSLWSGWLITRIGATLVMLAGLATGLMSMVLLPVSGITPGPTLLLSLIRGVSGGLLLTAGLTLAQSAAAEDDRVRALGLFNACFLLPALYGPALGEWTLRAWGDAGFFLVACIPAAIGLLLMLRYPPSDRAAPSTVGYLALLRDRHIWLPSVAMAAAGLGYIFAYSFLALLLTDALQTPVAWFFVPFAAGMFGTRFFGLRHLQRLPAWLLTGLGLLSYGVGFGCLAAAPAHAIVVPAVAGALFGFAYGVTGPAATAWACAPYPAGEASRARPIALTGASFQLGAVISVQVAGALLPMIGWSGVLTVLGALAATVFLVVIYHGVSGMRRRFSPGALDPRPGV